MPAPTTLKSSMATGTPIRPNTSSARTTSSGCVRQTRSENSTPMSPGGSPDFCMQLSTKLMKCGSVTAASERFTENAGGIALPDGGIAMQPGDQLADHAPVDHRCEPVNRGGLHHALGRGFFAVDHVTQQHFEAAHALGLAQPHQLLHAQHHFLFADLRVHGFERQRHRWLGFRRCLARHRVQGLCDLGGDIREDGGDRRCEKASRGVFVFGRRVFDHQQAHALQRRMEVAQCQHHGRARAVAAQEARLARRAQHEGVERIVQRMAKLDAEIGGGAVEHFAARIVERDGAITRVRQRMLEAGHPARRNFNDLLVEHRRADGRLARFSDEAAANVD